MAEEEEQLTIIEQFEANSIRKTWHQEEWWLCLPDIVAVFAGTKRASKYWYDLRKSIIEEEGYTELSARIGKLKFQLDNGRSYPMDAANISTVSRIIQSIRSPLAEPFKQWLASLATEEIQAIDDPELARENAQRYLVKSLYRRLQTIFTLRCKWSLPARRSTLNKFVKG
jgi:DNA-damage-inducible protein D